MKSLGTPSGMQRIVIISCECVWLCTSVYYNHCIITSLSAGLLAARG